MPAPSLRRHAAIRRTLTFNLRVAHIWMDGIWQYDEIPTARVLALAILYAYHSLRIKRFAWIRMFGRHRLQ